MEIGFFSWLLIFDGSGTPTLRRQELTIHPGQPFPRYSRTAHNTV